MAAIADRIGALASKDGGELYAVLDAARCPEVPQKLKETGAQHSVLNRFEPLTDELRAALPYVARCPADSPLASWFFEEGWGKAWGVLAVSRAELYSVQQHLTRQLIAETESGKSLLFRFYDPRVLRTFIPTCTPDQITAFYGPILRFVMEGESHDIVSYRRGGKI